MPDANVQFVMTAKDLATGKVREMKGELSGLQQVGLGVRQSFKDGLGIGAGISVVNLTKQAISGTVDFLKEAVHQAEMTETSQAGLGAALRANVPAWNGDTKAIEDTIRSRQKLAFSTGEQRESLGLLVTMTHDSTNALRIQRAAMDLARLKHIDLATASTVVGKAYLGNTNALNRMGISITKGSSGLDALAQVEKRVAGQAEAFSKTSAGAAAALGLEFQNLQATIGQKLLPAFTFLAEKAVDVVSAFEDMFVAADNFGRKLQEVSHNSGFEDVVASIIVGGIKVVRAVESMHDSVPAAFKGISGSAKANFKAISYAAWEGFDKVGQAGAAGMAALAKGVTDGAPSVLRAFLESDAGKIQLQVQAQAAKIRAAAYQNMVALAKGMIDGQNAPKVAFDAYVQIANESLSRMGEIARLKGILTGHQLASGLRSTNTVDRLAAGDAVIAISTRLHELGATSAEIGKDAGVALARGIASHKPTVNKAAQDMADEAKAHLRTASDGMEYFGGLVGAKFLAGLSSYYNAIRNESIALGNAAGTGLRLRSPAKAGALSDPGVMGGWGRKVGEMFAGGMRSSVGSIQAASLAMGGAAVPAFGGMSYGGGYGAGANITINVNAPLGTPAAGQAMARTLIPEVTREMRRQGLL